MENEYQALANTVQKTLDNLQNKKDFLIEQQHHYTTIRERLLKVKENNNDSTDSSYDDEEKGDIFGDIIISKKKIFLSIGYEYYVEKTVGETIEFVEDKLQLMVEAIEQFDLKIKEAKQTLNNLKMVIDHNPKIKIKEQEQENKIDEIELPTMEIREELDEDGNVLNGSVVPAATDSERQNIEDLINNKLVPKVEELKIDQKKLEDEITQDNGIPSHDGINEVDTPDIYSFADLVERMDEQDEENDGIIDSDEINYDYEKFKSMDNESDNVYSDDEYIDDDDNDEEEEKYFKMPGHLSLMDQINKLRNSRGQSYPVEEVKEIVNDNDDIVKESQPATDNSGKTHEKSIMKKKKNKVKKSVGFAPSLDVHEVESFKAETKRQTFNFPRNSNDLYSSVQDMMTDDTNNPNLHEFDNDLFASMIGAKQSDEIHDKYKDAITSNNDDEEQNSQELQENVKKVRVSRFKKDRGTVNKPPTDIIEKVNKSESNRAVSDVIVEREIIETIPEPKPKKRVSRFAQRKETQAKQPVESTASAIEPRDIITDVIEQTEPSQSTSNTKGASKKNGSLFKKTLSSLNKPRHSLNKKQEFPQELIDSLSDSEQEPEDEPVNRKREIVQKKIEEIKDDEEEDNDLMFPKEVQEAIKKVGKTEASLRVANVDYGALVDNMDDMVQAYTLGVYDDDLEEHPGVVVEKVEDFNTYNKQVDNLKDDIIDFKKNNPMVPINVDDKDEEDDDEDNGVIMTDIVEKDIPVNYRDIAEGYEINLGLHPDNIGDAVTKEYHTLRQGMLQQMRNMALKDKNNSEQESNHIHAEGEEQAENLAVEPIDEDGNPIRISRFKSQRMNLNP